MRAKPGRKAKKPHQEKLNMNLTELFKPESKKQTDDVEVSETLKKTEHDAVCL